MGSKTLTRVPPDEIASASLSKKSFSHYVRLLRPHDVLFSMNGGPDIDYRLAASLVRKKQRAINFQVFVKFMYQDQSACIHRHNYDN